MVIDIHLHYEFSIYKQFILIYFIEFLITTKFCLIYLHGMIDINFPQDLGVMHYVDARCHAKKGATFLVLS